MKFETENTVAENSTSDEATKEVTQRDLAEMIREAMVGMKPMTVRDIAERLGLQDLYVYNRITSMVKEGTVDVINKLGSQSRRYQLPPEGIMAEPEAPSPTFVEMTYNDVAEKLLAAIGARYCTLPQMKRHAGLGPRDDISVVLEGMVDDGLIEKLDNGNVSAYFRVKEIPKRFWLDGDSCGVEFADDAAELERKKQLINEKQAELAAKPVKPAGFLSSVLDSIRGRSPKPVDDLDLGDLMLEADLELDDDFDPDEVEIPAASEIEWNEGFRDIAEDDEPDAEAKPDTGKVTAKNPHSHTPKNIPWSVALFREAHERGENKVALAKRLGVAVPSVRQQLQKHPEYQAAFNGATDVSEPKRKPRGTTSAMTVEIVEHAAETCATLQDVARMAGNCGQPAFSRAINKDPQLRMAYDRGRGRWRAAKRGETVKKPLEDWLNEPKLDPVEAASEPLTEAVDPIEPTLTPFEPKSDITMEIEAEPTTNLVKPDFDKMLQNMRGSRPRSQNQKTVNMSAGSISIAFDGNFFELDRTARELLNDIANLVQAHQGGK